MKLKELLKVMNYQVRYKVTDRRTNEEVALSRGGKIDNDALARDVYMVYQESDGTLNIALY